MIGLNVESSERLMIMCESVFFFISDTSNTVGDNVGKLVKKKIDIWEKGKRGDE